MSHNSNRGELQLKALHSSQMLEFHDLDTKKDDMWGSCAFTGMHTVWIGLACFEGFEYFNK